MRKQYFATDRVCGRKVQKSIAPDFVFAPIWQNPRYDAVNFVVQA